MSKNMKSLCFLFLLSLCLVNSSFAQKQVMGLIEKVKIYPNELVLDAKLDTGADSCSLHASDIQELEKDGKSYVKFIIVDRYGKKQTVEKQVVRHIRIKRLDGKSQVRKMINLGLCLGGVYKIAEVSLVNRGKFNYEMLVGRRFLAGDFIVDPATTYTIDPSCKPTNVEDKVKDNSLKDEVSEDSNKENQ